MDRKTREAVLKSAGLVNDAKSCMIRIQQSLKPQFATEPVSREEFDFLEIEQRILSAKQELQLLDRVLAKLL